MFEDHHPSPPHFDSSVHRSGETPTGNMVTFNERHCTELAVLGVPTHAETGGVLVEDLIHALQNPAHRIDVYHTILQEYANIITNAPDSLKSHIDAYLTSTVHQDPAEREKLIEEINFHRHRSKTTIEALNMLIDFFQNEVEQKPDHPVPLTEEERARLPRIKKLFDRASQMHDTKTEELQIDALYEEFLKRLGEERKNGE